MMSWRDVVLCDDDLLNVACPTCKSPRGTWCVYMPPTTADYSHSRDVLAKKERAGTPTKKPHNARYNQARQVKYRKLNLAPPVERPSDDVLASLRAAQEFERRERETLRTWLRVNVTILLNLEMS